MPCQLDTVDIVLFIFFPFEMSIWIVGCTLLHTKTHKASMYDPFI